MFFPSWQRGLRRPGPRKNVHVSAEAKRIVQKAAIERRLTERVVLDEILEDAELVARAASRAEKRLKASEAGKTTHQDDSGRTQRGSDGL